MRVLILLLLGAVGISGHLTAQWPARIATGARVQVRLPEIQYQSSGGHKRRHLLRGKVAALATDTLYLAITDSLAPLPIPRHLIDRLEYSRGVPSRGVSALQRGLISGVASALFFVLINELYDDGTSAGTAALAGGGFGLVIGGVTGALYPVERWKRAQ